MTRDFRLPRQLYNSIQKDLSCPHSFAYERVGFIFCKEAGDGKVLIATHYDPVDNEDYIEDDYVGAKINSTAIRKAMQRSLNTGEAIFHVHAHDCFGLPSFSEVDQKSLSEMVPSFQKINPNIPHGAVLFSADACIVAVWPKGKHDPSFCEYVSVVGFPMSVWRYRNEE
jgi:hypothetical protein